MSLAAGLLVAEKKPGGLVIVAGRNCNSFQPGGRDLAGFSSSVTGSVLHHGQGGRLSDIMTH